MTTGWTTSVSYIETSNFDAAEVGLRRLYGDTKATIDDDFLWRADTATLGPVTLVKGSIDVPVQLDVTMARHALITTRATSMHISSTSGPFATMPGTKAALASPGKRVAVQIEPGQRTTNLTFAPEFLETQFTALTGETIRDLEFEFEFDLNTPSGALVDHLCQYLVEHVNGGTSNLPAALAASLCESLSRTLLFGHPHNHSYLLDKPAPASSRTVVRMVEEYVDAHADGPIVADDLARVTGVSVKSIEVAFRQHRQTTPLAFLRQKRLERARRRLLEDLSIPISQVAHAAGYLQLDPFLSAYFKAFKEHPAETRRRGFVGPTSALRSSQTLASPMPEARLSLLSERERQVCALVVQGRLNKQIADDLAITERTVKEHRANALKKLRVQSTAEMITLWNRLSR